MSNIPPAPATQAVPCVPPPTPVQNHRSVGLNIKYQEKSTPARISRAKITAVVAGTSVEIRMRLTFQNPHPKKLEGTLLVPLPETATVCDFGTLSHKTSNDDPDDDTNMMWASVVAKEVARAVFETEVRTGGKTATIVEQVRDHGNAYKTRLWPLPANGNYTVEIRYTDSLLSGAQTRGNTMEERANQRVRCFPKLPDHLIGRITGNGLLSPNDLIRLARTGQRLSSLISTAVLHLPLCFAGQADSLVVEVQDPSGSGIFGWKNSNNVNDDSESKSEENGAALPSLELAALPSSSSSSSLLNRPALACVVSNPVDAMLSVAIPSLVGGGVVGPLVQALQDEEGEEKEVYFSILDRAVSLEDVPTMAETTQSSSTASSKRYGIVWDYSLSHDPEASDASSNSVQREVDVLQQWCHTLPANSEILVVGLGHECHLVNTVLTTGADQEMTSMWPLPSDGTYGGATDLSSLSSLNSIAASLPVEYWVCVTDFVPTCGTEASYPEQQLPSSPCYVMSASVTSNQPSMKRLASDTGGRYVNLRGAMTPKSAAALIGTLSFGITRVEFDSSLLQDVEPSGPTPITPGSRDRIKVCGKFQAGVETAHVKLYYGYPGQPPMCTRSYRINANGAKNGTVVPRVWASARCQSIQARMPKGKEKDDALLSVGRKYHLVTPSTSLLVLEELEQFVKHNIVPPKSRPEIREKYIEQQREVEVTKEKEIARKIQSVQSMWSKRVAWWKQDFGPKTWEPPSQSKSKKKKSGRGMGGRGLGAGGAPRRSRAAVETLSAAHQGEQVLPTASHRRREPEQEEEEIECGGGWSDEDDDDFADEGEMKSCNLVGSGMAPPPPCAPSASSAPPPPPGRRGGGGGGQQQGESTIQVKGWDPKTPYIAKLKECMSSSTSNDTTATFNAIHNVYLQERREYKTSPSFYFDCGAFFFDAADTKKADVWVSLFRTMAISVVTSVLELGLEDANLVRLCAYMLRVKGCPEYASRLFALVLEMRPEEPQSHRDHALSLVALVEKRVQGCQGDSVATTLLKEEARIKKTLGHFARVVTGKWDSRFNEIEVTALQEMNAFLTSCRSWCNNEQHFVESVLDMTNVDLPVEECLPADLLLNLDLDLRVSLAWDTDMTDIDLHVIEPSGEMAYYSNNRTRIGGCVSRDFTQGYGPEEYMIKCAMPGKYKIQAKYYSNSRQDLSGATSLLLTLSTGFGRPGEEIHRLTAVRLSTNKDIVDVGEFEVKHQQQQPEPVTMNRPESGRINKKKCVQGSGSTVYHQAAQFIQELILRDASRKVLAAQIGNHDVVQRAKTAWNNECGGEGKISGWIQNSEECSALGITWGQEYHQDGRPVAGSQYVALADPGRLAGGGGGGDGGGEQ